MGRMRMLGKDGDSGEGWGHWRKMKTLEMGNGTWAG